MRTIIEELNAIVANYETETIEIAPNLPYSQYNTLKKIDFYTNSKYLKGNKDAKGREKPFYNIVNAIVDTSVVATDIDTKDIQIIADDKKDYVRSFLLSKDVYNWMKETDFASFLNEMGETRARYGGVLVKKTEEYDEDEKENQMEIEVVQWSNVVTDQCDIEDGVIVEKHYMTVSELASKKDVWDNVAELINSYAKDKKFTATSSRIPIFEIHGEFPVNLNPETPDADITEYESRCYYVGGDSSKKQFVMYSEVEKESPYKYLAWKKVSKRGLGRGVVEEGFEAQQWTNDAMLKEKAAMEIASKIVFSTTSKKVGSNVNSVDNGHIIELDQNEQFNQVNTMSNALPEFRSLQERWFAQYEKATAAYDAQRGETPPSGQPYRLQALVQQQSGSTFDYRREDAGIFLTEIFSDWVLPYLIKKMSKAHILAYEFSADELKMIDDSFSINQANAKITDDILDGKVVTQEDYQAYYDSALNEVQSTKSHRFIDIPKDYFKNIEAKISIITTGENKNKQATMETLSNVLMTISKMPNWRDDPVLSEAVGHIMEISGSGISPATLAAKPTPQQPAQPQMQAPVAQPVQ